MGSKGNSQRSEILKTVLEMKKEDSKINTEYVKSCREKIREVKGQMN